MAPGGDRFKGCSSTVSSGNLTVTSGASALIGPFADRHLHTENLIRYE